MNEEQQQEKSSYQKPEIFEISYVSVVCGATCLKNTGGGEEECDPDLFTE